jgi:type II secretion system protein H
MSRSHLQRGFTLIELLVSLVIVAVMAGAVLFSLGPAGDDRQLRREADRLLDVVQRIADVALFSGRPVGLQLSATAYRVTQRVNRQWQDYQPGQEMLGRREMPDGVRLSVADALGGWDEQPQVTIVFDPEGTADPVVVRIAGHGRTLEARLRVSAMAEVELEMLADPARGM